MIDELANLTLLQLIVGDAYDLRWSFLNFVIMNTLHHLGIRIVEVYLPSRGHALGITIQHNWTLADFT